MKPNIICIITDDQGPWALGCAGNDELQTPHLDRLAREGVRFENMFCVSPVCSPARASIMTGKIPSQHGIQDWLRLGNSTVESPEGGPLIEYLKDHPGYTSILSENGYNCGLSGKWHLGDAHHPQMGFSYWYAHAKGASDYYNAPMIENGRLYEEPAYVTETITDRAIGFLDAQTPGVPFCLHVHYTAPHSPWDAGNHPAEYFDHYYNHCAFRSVPDKPIHPWQINSAPIGYDPESRRNILSGYYAAVSAMDANIGRLLEWLDTHGLREQTIVFFTSDNGMNMGHHGIYGKGNGTLPQNMFDTSTKVPAMISWPGTIPEGGVLDGLVSHYDYQPTILELLGFSEKIDKTLPGQSISLLLRGDEISVHDHVVVFNEYGPVRMIRNSRWKYVHRYPFGPHELYNIEDDPSEAHDLFGIPTYREIWETMRGDLSSWFARYVDPRVDGSKEKITGRGQIGLTGLAAKGKENFSQDYFYYADNKEGVIGFGY